MAKVQLLRGSQNKIKKSQYNDGNIYLAKDKYKLFMDYENFRNELNNGILLEVPLTIPAQSKEVELNLLEYLTDGSINLQDSNLIIQIQPKNNSIEYIQYKIYCDEISSSHSLHFIADNKPEEVEYKGDITIFIYDAALQSRRIDVSNLEVITALASNWNNENEMYNNTISDAALSSNAISLIAQQNDTSDYYAIKDVEITSTGALVLNATYQPLEDIALYIYQLDSSITGVQQTIYANNWQDNEQQILMPTINENSIVLIQFIDNIEEQTLITTIKPENGYIAIMSEHTPEKDIQINVIDLTDKVELYEKTLSAINWSTDYDTHPQQSLSLDRPLQCGTDGNLVPIIFCNDYHELFNNIYGITINADKDVLTAHSKYMIKQDLPITIVDFII